MILMESRSVYFGDMQPKNILIGAEGVCKITDFKFL